MDLLTAVKLEGLDQITKIIKNQGIPFTDKWTDYESLNTALTCGKKEVAIFLLDQKCRVNKTLKKSSIIVQESSPLHNAVKLRDEQIVRKLLKRKASVLASDSEKNSALHLAFFTRQESLVDLLLENIQQTSNYTNLRNKHGISHFHIACTRQNVQVIQGFLDAKVNIEDVVNENSPSWAGFAAIHFAVNFKSLEALKILLKLDAKQLKINAGETPLELAYQNIQDWMIMIDLMRAASPDWNTNKKFSYFHLACLNDDPAVVEKFIDHGAAVNSVTPWDLPVNSLSSSLHCAVTSGDKEKVRLLLQRGAAVDFTNSAGMTALHLALYNENFSCPDSVEIVDMLYAHVRDKTANRVDENGLGYFHVAITRNDVATVRKYLVKGKLNVDQPLSRRAKNFANYTPLHLAVWYQHPEVVRLLVENGADVNASSDDAQGTPVHMAFEAGDVDFIELFLRHDARLDLVVVGARKTMLHLLVIHCFLEVKSRRGDSLLGRESEILLFIQHLVKLGIDVNARDRQGYTALHLVDPSREGCAKYFKLLLDLGADINLEDNMGRLPFKVDETRTERFSSEEYVIFYDHVQKLKDLGLTVHPKNEESCWMIVEGGKFEETELNAKQMRRFEEIDRLKAVKLDAVTSVFDFVKLDPIRAALYARCEPLRAIVEDGQLTSEYPAFGYLVRLRYQACIPSAEKFSDKEGFSKRQRCE